MMMTATTEKLKVTLFQGGGLQGEIDVPDSLKFLEDGQKRQSAQHMFRIVNQKDGDKRVVWDANSLAEIQDAKEMFDQLVAQGMVPYKVDLKGKKTPEVMREFDPLAEEIIFAPIAALAGG